MPNQDLTLTHVGGNTVFHKHRVLVNIFLRYKFRMPRNGEDAPCWVARI